MQVPTKHGLFVYARNQIVSDYTDIPRYLGCEAGRKSADGTLVLNRGCRYNN